MHLLVMENHDGYGVFPRFEKGTAVDNAAACKEYPHWLSCVLGGYETFIPETFVEGGILNRDYNPTELIIQKGEIVSLIELVFEWAYVRERSGKKGWLPASKIVTVP